MNEFARLLHKKYGKGECRAARNQKLIGLPIAHTAVLGHHQPKLAVDVVMQGAASDELAEFVFQLPKGADLLPAKTMVNPGREFGQARVGGKGGRRHRRCGGAAAGLHLLGSVFHHGHHHTVAFGIVAA
jgi:hypothetical protein